MGKKKKKKEKNIELFNSLLVGLVSGLVVVLVQQFFFSRNSDYELKNKIIEENYEFYVAVQNFSDLPSYVIYKQKLIKNLVILDTINKSKNTITTENIIPTKIPIIAYDSLEQAKWKTEKKYIIENKNKIAPELFYLFENVTRIVDENPWPNINESDSIKKSIWAKKDFMDNWFDENMKLWELSKTYTKSRLVRGSE